MYFGVAVLASFLCRRFIAMTSDSDAQHTTLHTQVHYSSGSTSIVQHGAKAHREVWHNTES